MFKKLMVALIAASMLVGVVVPTATRADVKISGLPAAAPAGADLVPIVHSGVTSQTTVQQIINLVPTPAPASGGSGGGCILASCLMPANTLEATFGSAIPYTFNRFLNVKQSAAYPLATPPPGVSSALYLLNAQYGDQTPFAFQSPAPGSPYPGYDNQVAQHPRGFSVGQVNDPTADNQSFYYYANHNDLRANLYGGQYYTEGVNNGIRMSSYKYDRLSHDPFYSSSDIWMHVPACTGDGLNFHDRGGRYGACNAGELDFTDMHNQYNPFVSFDSLEGTIYVQDNNGTYDTSSYGANYIMMVNSQWWSYPAAPTTAAATPAPYNTAGPLAGAPSPNPTSTATAAPQPLCKTGDFYTDSLNQRTDQTANAAHHPTASDFQNTVGYLCSSENQYVAGNTQFPVSRTGTGWHPIQTSDSDTIVVKIKAIINGVSIYAGTGAPTITCTTGDQYNQKDGTVGATLYICGGGTWRAVAGV